MNIEQVVIDFCRSHGIVIVDTNKRAHKFSKVNTKYFQNSYDYNSIDQKIVYETEPLYTIEISKSQLEKIAEFENQVFANMRTKGHYGLFEILMEQKEKEKFLKENYPAVKKAYEQYSLMLKLAESGEL